MPLGIMIVAAIAIVIGIFLITVDDWANSCSLPIKIKFEKFIVLYEENSNLWELRRSYVVFEPTSMTSHYARFSFIDYCRYRMWKWDINRKYKKEQIARECLDFEKSINRFYKGD